MADQATPKPPPIITAITEFETGKQLLEIFQYASAKIKMGKKISTAMLSMAKLYFPM